MDICVYRTYRLLCLDINLTNPRPGQSMEYSRVKGKVKSTLQQAIKTQKFE